MNSKAPTIPVLHIRIRIRINCIRIFNIIQFFFSTTPDGNGNLCLRTDDFNSKRIFFRPGFDIKSNDGGEKQSQPIFRIFHNFPSVCLPFFVW